MNERCRHFAFMVYPEAMPNDFNNILVSSGGKGFYIFHGLDKLEDGTDKKPHYHVVVMFENQRYLNSVKRLGLRCNAVNGHVEPIRNLLSCARYLCHMDNSEKHQYDPFEVTCFGGANYLELCEMKIDKKAKCREMVCQITKYICDNQIYSYAQLFEFCCDYRHDWLDYLLMPSIGRAILEYIKSKNWTDNKAKYN